MNSDSIFVIGDSHEVCEDYSLHKDLPSVNISHAVTSDGCSGSPHTDIGARILVHSSLGDEQLTNIIHRAKLVTENMRVSGMCLDATLLRLSAVKSNNSTTIYADMAGDGYLVFKEKNKLTVFEGNAPNGYPLYLSYLLSDNRRNNYIQSNGLPTVSKYRLIYDEATSEWYKEKGSEEELELSKEGIFSIKRVFTSEVTVAVFSDGVASFSIKGAGPVDPIKVITELLSLKNTREEFVKRRVKAALKKFKKQDWTHHDDVSMAAIYVEK